MSCKIDWFLLLLSMILVNWACEGEKESGIILIVKPEGLVRNAEVGEKILYSMEAYSNEGMVEKLSMSSYDTEQGLQVVLDSIIGKSRINLTYQYTVPQLKDTTNVKIFFTASNEYGETVEIQKFVKVSGGEAALAELTGITMYAKPSGRPDAYHLESEQLVNSHTVESDSLLDIYAWQDSTANEDILSREWRSHTGIHFIRFNSFNYATATKSGLENAYSSGIKMNYIRNLQAEDIIIFGDEHQALGIIKLIYVFDEPGKMDDRYIFNLKRIKS